MNLLIRYFIAIVATFATILFILLVAALGLELFKNGQSFALKEVLISWWVLSVPVMAGTGFLMVVAIVPLHWLLSRLGCISRWYAPLLIGAISIPLLVLLGGSTGGDIMMISVLALWVSIVFWTFEKRL
ncbi:MAG: hypothetical protein ACI8WB_004234 [Phenylobacterium sp.]|jgi:hypothetical protein